MSAGKSTWLLEAAATGGLFRLKSMVRVRLVCVVSQPRVGMIGVSGSAHGLPVGVQLFVWLHLTNLNNARLAGALAGAAQCVLLGWL